MKRKFLFGSVVAICAVWASLVGLSAAWTTDDLFTPEFLAQLDAGAPTFQIAEQRTSPELLPPVRLEADGQPIDIGKLSPIAHAGPCIFDVDGDGDRDLLVGDFPGHFWLFDNVGTDERPRYTGKGKLRAGGQDAKTPVY